ASSHSPSRFPRTGCPGGRSVIHRPFGEQELSTPQELWRVSRPRPVYPSLTHFGHPPNHRKPFPAHGRPTPLTGNASDAPRIRPGQPHVTFQPRSPTKSANPFSVPLASAPQKKRVPSPMSGVHAAKH